MIPIEGVFTEEDKATRWQVIKPFFFMTDEEAKISKFTWKKFCEIDPPLYKEVTNIRPGNTN